MSNHRMSTPEASKALGIPVHVITYWLGQIPYPAEQDERGDWRLTPEAMAVLQTVKDLKEQNRTMDTIRRHVKEIQDHPPAPVRPAGPPPEARPAGQAPGGPAPNGQAPHGRPPARPQGPRPEGARPDGRPAPQGPGPSQPHGQPSQGQGQPPHAQGQPPQGQGQPPQGQPAQGQGPPPQGQKPANRPAQGPRKQGPPPGQAPSQGRPPAPPQGQAIAPAAHAPVPLGDQRDLAAHVARAVSEAVRQETMLAQRYAHAAHQIGKLEAENEHLKTMLTAAQHKHTREMDDARAKIAELEAAKAAPKPKTRWWAWMVGLAVLL